MAQADGNVVGQRLPGVLFVGQDGRVVGGVRIDGVGQVGLDLFVAPRRVVGAGQPGVVLADHVLVLLRGHALAPRLHA